MRVMPLQTSMGYINLRSKVILLAYFAALGDLFYSSYCQTLPKRGQGVFYPARHRLFMTSPRFFLARTFSLGFFPALYFL